jgi:hypothetical protein
MICAVDVLLCCFNRFTAHQLLLMALAAPADDSIGEAAYELFPGELLQHGQAPPSYCVE